MCSIQSKVKKRPFCSVVSTQIFSNLSVFVSYQETAAAGPHANSRLAHKVLIPISRQRYMF